ncbi:MAG: hypothetical protein AAGA53_16540 [Pseudomonadota bacterium]
MAAFEKSSRYVKYAEVYLSKDRTGREVRALTPAEIPLQPELGIHLRRDGQRLDHLASHYLDHTTGYWRIARINDAMSPDVLTDKRQIKIPGKG